MQSRIQKEYLRQVRRVLHCPVRDKWRIVKPLKKSTSHYLAEEPTASMDELEEIFGTPESIAGAYYLSLETKEIRKRFRVRWMLGMTCAVIIVGLVIWYHVLWEVASQDIPAYSIESEETLEKIQNGEVPVDEIEEMDGVERLPDQE